MGNSIQIVIGEVGLVGGCGDINQGCFSADLDHCRAASNPKTNVQGRKVTDLNSDVFTLYSLEAPCARGDGVGTWRKVRKAVIAAGTCRKTLLA